MTSRTLCRIEEIDDPGARAFDVAGDDRQVFVVRRGGSVWGYVNDCPHWNISLDFVPGRFLNLERTMILCSNHGARFRFEDGRCEWGPCRGESLTPAPVRLEGDRVVLGEREAGVDDFRQPERHRRGRSPASRANNE